MSREWGATCVALAVALLALGLVGCMSPNVYREDMPIKLSQTETPPPPDGTNPVMKKGWTEGPSPWAEKGVGPTTAYSKDQKYMILMRKPRVSTRKHSRDLISDMIWAREKLDD